MFKFHSSMYLQRKVCGRADTMSNPGEGKVPPEPLDPRDNPKVLTVEDLEKAALGPGSKADASSPGESGNGADGGGGGGGQDRQILNPLTMILMLFEAIAFVLGFLVDITPDMTVFTMPKCTFMLEYHESMTSGLCMLRIVSMDTILQYLSLIRRPGQVHGDDGRVGQGCGRR